MLLGSKLGDVHSDFKINNLSEKQKNKLRFHVCIRDIVLDKEACIALINKVFL